jgi:hypothetical protein
MILPILNLVRYIFNTEDYAKSNLERRNKFRAGLYPR